MKISALLLCILLIAAVALAHRSPHKSGKIGHNKSSGHKWSGKHHGKGHHGGKPSKSNGDSSHPDTIDDNFAGLKKMCVLQDDDKTYDLSSLQGMSSSMVDEKGRLWWLSACGPVAAPSCDAGAAVCIEPGHINGGLAAGALWSLTPHDNQISITYGNGDQCGADGQTRKTVYILDCAKDGPLTPQINSIKEHDPCFTEVFAISSAACPVTNEIDEDGANDGHHRHHRDHDSPAFLIFMIFSTCALCCCCCACIKRRNRHNKLKKMKEMVEFSNVAFQQIPLEEPVAEAPQYPGNYPINGQYPYPVPMFFPPSGQLSAPQYFLYPQVQHPMAPAPQSAPQSAPVQVYSDEMLARQLQAKFDSEV